MVSATCRSVWPDIGLRNGWPGAAPAIGRLKSSRCLMTTTISIPLAEEQMRRLRELAERISVPPEELARAGLEDWLRQPRQDFVEAARYILQKNAELYRR